MTGRTEYLDEKLCDFLDAKALKGESGKKEEKSNETIKRLLKVK